MQRTGGHVGVCGGGPWVCMHDSNVGGLVRVCVCVWEGVVGRINGTLPSCFTPKHDGEKKNTNM